MTTPNITPDSFDETSPNYMIAFLTFSSAIDKLELAKAWPNVKAGAYSINLGPGNRITTHWKAKPESASSRKLVLDSSENFRIQIGADIFETGVGALLAQKTKLPLEDVAFPLLAHEIFHLTELDRMIACGVEYGNHHSSRFINLWEYLATFPQRLRGRLGAPP